MPRRPSAPSSALVWSRPSRGRRRDGLGHRLIVRAAVRLADDTGLPGLSMRRVADELGAGAMSLYRHVASKEDLLDLMLDAAFGEMKVPRRPSGDWRRDLRSLAWQLRRVLRRHPWAAQLVASRPPLGPRYLAWFELSLAAVRATGVDVRAATRVIGTLNAFVAGVVAYEHGDSEARRRHGLSESQMREAVAPYLRDLLASGRHPNVAEFVAEGTGEATDADFEFGLECVLDGLEAALRRLARARPAPRPRGDPGYNPRRNRG